MVAQNAKKASPIFAVSRSVVIFRRRFERDSRTERVFGPTGAEFTARIPVTENGLRAAEPADRNTLVRRLSYALTGLPPTPEEVQAFVADDSPDAYSRVVDRLLASPRSLPVCSGGVTSCKIEKTSSFLACEFPNPAKTITVKVPLDGMAPGCVTTPRTPILRAHSPCCATMV